MNYDINQLMIDILSLKKQEENPYITQVLRNELRGEIIKYEVDLLKKLYEQYKGEHITCNRCNFSIQCECML